MEIEMKKFFVALLVFIFISCGSDKTTGERLPYSEITDEDIVNSEPETTDEETDMDSDPDADVTENDDTDYDDSNTPNIDPCEPNPCSDIANATGDCIVKGENLYSCECVHEYHWTGSICKSNAPTDPVPLGNLCTEQDKCYDGFGSSAIDCPAEGEKFYGQDAQYAELGCIHHSFTVSEVDGNNIVIDNNTGLIWQPADMKEVFPYFEEYTWQEANDKCAALNDSNYAGYSDWRLPTPMELLTISENDNINRVFNILKIVYSDPNLNREPRCLWTSEEYDADSVYYFGPFDGWVWNGASKENTYQMLCVRGDKLPNGFFTETTENGKSVIVDSTTGLMWQKEYILINNWLEALAYCQTLNDEKYADHTDWRLPNKNELASLLNYDKSSVLYSDFPEMPDEDSRFWSSTTSLTTYNDMIWIVDFDLGVVSRNYKTNTNSLDIRYVRCVR